MAAPTVLFRTSACLQFRLNLQKSIANCREISTGDVCLGKKNFRKFQTFNKRGTLAHRKKYQHNPLYDLGVRPIGVWRNNAFHRIPEMIPELIVPDLTGFELKPYVSYRAPDVYQSRFTAKDLFDACYEEKVISDFENGKLDDDGNPLEPSENEKMTADEARIKDRLTGSDQF